MNEHDSSNANKHEFHAGTNEYSHLGTESASDQPSQPEPRVIYKKGAEHSISVDAGQIGQTMRELGMPPSEIDQTTVIVDAKNRFSSNGVTYPKGFRSLHRLNPSLRGTPGTVVRFSTQKHHQPRSEEAMNETLVHELEHVAQLHRGDNNLKRGWAGIIGLGVAGAIAGKLATEKSSRLPTKVIGTIIGAIVGQQIGYKIAPHEKQARDRAEEIRTDAIKRKDN